MRLSEAPADERAFHVAYTVGVEGADWAAADVSDTLARLGAVTEQPRRVRIWHSQGATAAGVRLVESDAIALGSGRLPSPECPSAICEAVALAGDFRLGEIVEVDEQTLLPLPSPAAGRPTTCRRYRRRRPHRQLGRYSR